MIRVREYGTPVLRGISRSSNDQYADLWISTSLFSLNLRWVKPERRLIVNGYRKAVGPWNKIRELEGRLAQAERQCADFERELGKACDRYDKVREMNTQLRDALSLYRNA